MLDTADQHEIRIGELRGTAYPAPNMKRAMRRLYGLGTVIPFDRAMTSALEIITLERFLVGAIEEAKDEHGVVDYRVVAAAIIGALSKHPEGVEP